MNLADIAVELRQLMGRFEDLNGHAPDYCPCGDEECDLRGEWWCSIDQQHEHVTEHTYLRCFECGHVYETDQDLVDAWEEIGCDTQGCCCNDPAPPAHEISFCQVCLHDF